MNRWRTANGPFYGGQPCHGATQASTSCNSFSCPVDCAWEAWGTWGECSASCGEGNQQPKQTMTRDANAPVMGGNSCPGQNTAWRYCNNFACPVDCFWGQWEEWTECPVSCGGDAGHVHVRHRPFDPEVAHGGVPCLGAQQLKQPCNQAENVPCPVDCIWSNWREWGECSHSCGNQGVMYRDRVPSLNASHGGLECPGRSTDRTACNVHNCPVNCEWAEWDEWRLCSRSCGGGVRQAVRQILRHARFGGVKCEGSDINNGTCGEQACPETPVERHWLFSLFW